MTSHKHSQTVYKETLKKTEAHLTPFEKFLSSIIHRRFVDLIASSLEHTLFRTTPMIVGFILTLFAGVFMIAVAFIFNYQVVSLSILGIIFGLGFIIGFIYDTIRRL